VNVERKREIFLLLNASIATAIALAGCAESNPSQATGPNGGKFYAVITDSAPFYRYGPQQGNGPDIKLQKDRLMTLIRPSFGYCKVKLTTGEQGYVASDDIGPAPPALVAAATAPPPHPSRAAHFPFDSSDPRLIEPQESLPEFNPEPTPIPGLSPPGN
jgi:hypothetical protein